MADPVEPPVALPEETVEESSSATEIFNSVKVSLADLCAKGTAQYAHKNYSEAADLYARASELQAELNGEMSPDNAEILFLYGRSVFKVGQSKSDILGGAAAGEKKKKKKAPAPLKEEEKVKGEPKTESEQVTEAGVAIVAGQNGESDVDTKKPLFTFAGDENFEDSDEEDEDGEGEEEEEDDLAAAFEILDLARVLFVKKLELAEGEGKGKEVGDDAMTKHFKDRLADTHDILAEISLENESFPAAVHDSRASLKYKKDLFPEEAPQIAEAHFKLSLALEFASNTHDGASTENEADDSQKLRDEAVVEMQAAIDSTKANLQAKEVDLASSSSPDDNDILRGVIADVREMLGDLENRLAELKAGPVDVDGMKSALGMAAGNAMGGILGATLGESPAEANARIEEAKKNANDLSGLVRRKKDDKDDKATTPEPSAQSNGTSGKRKAEEDLVEGGETVKKAKVEDALEAQGE